MSQKSSITGIIDGAISELKERLNDKGNSEEPGDMIHEIADGRVPIYTNELLAVALSDLGLATSEPELGPAFDGRSTPVNLIAANIYEKVVEKLWEWYNENK